MPPRLVKVLLVLGLLAPLVLAHALLYRPTEPFFNNDETRHVMTGVFFRDLFADHPVADLPDYAVRYYVQYPALGLLVWPPLFYVALGLFMLAFGTSVIAAKVLVALFAALACVYLFRLAERTHGRPTAAVAVLLFGFAPLVFAYSRQVMLEVPTVACALAAVYHGQAYLDGLRRRDLVLCALATAGTALTRFDGVFLAPLFLILLAGERRLAMLRRWEVLLAVGLAVLVVLPFYGLTLHGFGGAHLQAVSSGTCEGSTGFLAPRNFVYYPSVVPQQIGWFAVAPALFGLALALTPGRRARSWPYLALVAATYITFTPMAEIEPRHTIYWVPALAVFAADGVLFLSMMDSVRWTQYSAALAGVVVVGTVWLTCREPAPYVRGYEEAARYVVEHTHDSPTCLFDSFLNGDFIYQIHRHDPERRLWVLRGDKLFYGVLSDPHAEYEEWVKGEDGILDLIYRYDPEYLVIEDPQVYFHMPMPEVVRRVLHGHPERFRLVATIPVQSNTLGPRPIALEVFRNLKRNDHPDRCVEFEVLGMHRRIETTLPGKPGGRDHADNPAGTATAAAAAAPQDR
jgi:4-amino-4-deoxy-L-arabinose transferase-like glycosyltransferase